MIPRFMLVAGLTVLALVFFSPELKAMGKNIDLELILPIALGNFIPTGLKGLVIAGLLAAFMSTIASFINVAPAYLVNDVYRKYIRPEAGNRRLIAMSYLASALVLAAGIGFGFVVQTVDSITKWIVTALWAGYAAPNMLKWYWWRFNGHGFFWGMFTGLLAALITPKLMPGITQIWHFPFVFLASLAACFIASLITKPENNELLMKFYSTVRPWGFWKPVHEMVTRKDPSFKRNKGFKKDMFNVAVGIIWQLCIIAFPVYLVIEDFRSVAIVAVVILAGSWILKKNWLDRLEN